MERMLMTFLVLGSMGLMAQVIDRTKPPATPPIPAYKLPPVYETRLGNRLAVVMVEDARFPLVTVRLGFLAGNKFDPPDLPGLSEAVAALLTQGTQSRTSRQIAEELAAIGGALNGASGPDAITVSGSVLSENTPKLLELLADVARHASFPEKEVELRKQNRAQELEAQRSEPSFLADEKFAEVVFGSHPYSRIAPTPQSIARIDRKALASFAQTYLVPNNATLILLGRLPARAEALKLVEEYLGSWQQKALPAPPKPDFPETRHAVYLVDRPGSVQADIHVGGLAVTRADPDFFPLSVGSVVLGGGGSSRMFLNIREKKGYAYDAHAILQPKRDAGDLAAVTQVRNEVIEPAMQAVLDELKGMVSDPPSKDELDRTQNFMSGLFVLRLETQNGLATQLITAKLMGLPNSYLERYVESVRAVTPAQIQQVAKKYMAPEKAAIVVVGDASKISKPLEKFGTLTVSKAN
ncbi:MAG TPA: pitrilysin family protein [Bryobacteraceae bacterium]|nr:pitrilysin family protein [Bryobacteraceae bacterium]